MRSLLGGMGRIGYAVRHSSTMLDKELQSSYGLIPRLRALEKLFFSEVDRSCLKELVAGDFKIEHALVGLKVYSDLQNPLLKKYGFDSVDFVNGASQAVTETQKLMASKNLSNYSSGESTDSTAIDSLKLIMSPFLLHATRAAHEDMAELGHSMVLTDFRLDRIAISNIEAKIFCHNELKTQRDRMALAGIAMNREIVNDEEGVEEEFVYHEEALLYPDGSVIASVDVVFECSEKYNCKMRDLETEEIVETNPSRTTQAIWTFEGCISGQTELDWRLVDLDRKCGTVTGRFVRQAKVVQN